MSFSTILTFLASGSGHSPAKVSVTQRTTLGTRLFHPHIRGIVHRDPLRDVVVQDVVPVHRAVHMAQPGIVDEGHVATHDFLQRDEAQLPQANVGRHEERVRHLLLDVEGPAADHPQTGQREEGPVDFGDEDVAGNFADLPEEGQVVVLVDVGDLEIALHVGAVLVAPLEVAYVHRVIHARNQRHIRSIAD